MSSKAIAAATQHFLQFRIQYASIVLLYWDYVLTLRDEIEYLWSGKKLLKLSNPLYILCRYALLANVLYLLAVSGKLQSSCDTWYKFIGIISVLGRAAVITVFTLRAYAVWFQNKLVLVGLGWMAFTCVTLDCLHITGLRCSGSTDTLLFNELLSILVCTFESTATILTIVRCIQSLKKEWSVLAQKNALMYIILEQGILYFRYFTHIAQFQERPLTMQTWARNHRYSAISCFTIAAIILNFKAPNNFLQRLLNALTLLLSGILTARFLLHLRAIDASQWIRRYGRRRRGYRVLQTDVYVPSFFNCGCRRIDEDPIFPARNRSSTASNAPENDERDNTHTRPFDEESALSANPHAPYKRRNRHNRIVQ